MKLKHNQIRQIKSYFCNEPGYVLNFTNQTFAEFFDDYMNIDIYDDKFKVDSGSKQKRLFAYLAMCPAIDGKKLLRELWREKNSAENAELNSRIRFSDYEMNIEELGVRLRNRSLQDEEFEAFLDGIQDNGSIPIEIVALDRLDHEELRDNISKIKRKLPEGDYSGAITNCYALVERLLKLLLEENNVEYKSTQGDIRQLYSQLIVPLNLDPASENMPSSLRPILEGLKKIIGGLFEVSNKSGDRHATTFKASKRHANLVINSTITICEFLIESNEFSQSMSRER